MQPSTEMTSSRISLEPSVQPQDQAKRGSETDHRIVNVVQHMNKFQTEGTLQQLFNQIDKSNERPLKKVIHVGFDTFCEEGKERPMITLAKVIISLIGLSAVYPAAVGSWACLKTLEITPLSDLESSDRKVAMVAAQNYGNLGMAITYIVQLHEFVINPILHHLKEPYNKRVCEAIRATYEKALDNNRESLTPESIDLLIQRENMELSRYDGLPVSDRVNVDVIQSKIDREKKERLSAKNIIYLTAWQIKEDAKKSPWSEIVSKITQAALVVGVVGASWSILSIGTYGCYKPFDLQSPLELQSSDPEKVEDAVANYANAGHGLEYVAVMGILAFNSAKLMLGDQYKKAVNKQICEAYEPYIRSGTQSVTDLLYERRNQELLN